VRVVLYGEGGSIHRLFQFDFFKVNDFSGNLYVGSEMTYHTDLEEVECEDAK
jgi:hypothetical protein